MADRLGHIDEKIQQLKKKREKVQADQALSFLKETQKIFRQEFSPELALTVLLESWQGAPEVKKEAWKKRMKTFPSPGFCSRRKEDHAPNATDHLQ